MKKLILISAIAVSGLFYNSANAQIRVHFGIRFAPRPVYVPARVVVAAPAQVEYNEPANYDGDEDYYYLPDVDAYYSNTENCYYYNNGDSWVSATYLPGAYRDYDWRSARRYEVRAHRPYLRNDFYRARYDGVAFNGRWNERVYDRGYNSNRFDHDAYRRDDRRFDNHYGRDDRRFDNHNGDRRFAQNYNQGHGRSDRDNHRPGRF